MSSSSFDIIKDHAALLIAIVLVASVLVLSLNMHVATTPMMTSNMVPPSTSFAPYQTPMTTPPFEWNRKTDLYQSQSSMAPKYGQVSLDWTLPGSERPWRGSEEASNLSGPSLGESYMVTPMLSYDFPNAGMSRDVNMGGSGLSSATSAAGFQELGFSRTGAQNGELGYKDLVSPDSLGMPNPRLLNPYLTGK